MACNPRGAELSGAIMKMIAFKIAAAFFQG
jgi:hypothetical protein